MTRTRDSVARADFDSGAFGDLRSTESTEHIAVEDAHFREDFEIHLKDEGSYPFPEQEILQGEYDYTNQSPLGDEEAAGSFQFRQGSNLFLIRKQSGPAPIRRIASAFRDAYSPLVQIHEEYMPAREAIWNLVEKASWKDKIRVLDDLGEEVELAKLVEQTELSPEELYGRYPLISVNLIIETPWGESTKVRYDQGHLEVSSSDDDIYEYVLQRFERDVVGYK